MKWKEQLIHRGLDTQDVIEEAYLRLADRLGLLEPVRVVLYDGWLDDDQQALVRGRVVAGPAIRPPRPEDGAWHNSRAMIQRFTAHGLPNATLQIAGQTIHTDDAGYFSCQQSLASPPQGQTEENTTTSEPAQAPWTKVEATLLEPRPDDQRRLRFEGRLLQNRPAEIGVISDLDDTVIPSRATNLATLVRSTLTSNALNREPFPGVASFFRALAEGPQDSSQDNPFFYVSSSAWQLHDFFQLLFEIHRLPAGPLNLKQFGLDRQRFQLGKHDEHKLESIQRILASRPDLDFVLVGDTGQRDPEIYQTIAREHPERIRAIYLRSVGMENEPRILTIRQQLRELNLPLIASPHMLDCAEHACSLGLIDNTQLQELTRDMAHSARLWPRVKALPGSTTTKIAVAAGLGASLGALAGFWMGKKVG